MLSAKPWKADAIIRLGLSVLVCVYAGSLLVSASHYAGGGERAANQTLFYALAGIALICLGVTLVLICGPWRLEAFGRRMLVLLLCGYGGMFVGAWVQHKVALGANDVSIWRIVAATVSFQGASLILIARFLREQRMTWTESFGLRNHRRLAVLLGVLGAVLFVPVGWGLQQASALVMTHLPHLQMEPQEQLPIQALRISVSWGGRAALGAAAILLAPVAEEMLFRGILYLAIKQAGFPRLAVWGTSLLFAAIHLNLVTFVPLTVLALVLTALYERADNLLAPIAAHVVFNALNFGLLLFLEQSGGL